jgi:drug/metabolite transporter superfamily protein YnfA
MFARLGAKIFLAMVGLALVFCGVGFVMLGIATVLRPYVGAAWGDVIAGGIFVGPPLIWALALASTRPPKRDMSAGARQIVAALIAAAVKETPWLAIVSAGLAGAADMFLKRNKSKK